MSTALCPSVLEDNFGAYDAAGVFAVLADRCDEVDVKLAEVGTALPSFLSLLVANVTGHTGAASTALSSAAGSSAAGSSAAGPPADGSSAAGSSSGAKPTASKDVGLQ